MCPTIKHSASIVKDVYKEFLTVKKKVFMFIKLIKKARYKKMYILSDFKCFKNEQKK